MKCDKCGEEISIKNSAMWGDYAYLPVREYDCQGYLCGFQLRYEDSWGDFRRVNYELCQHCFRLLYKKYIG